MKDVVHSPASRRAAFPAGGMVIAALLVLVAGWVAWLWQDSGNGPPVVVYCAQDQVLAEPILNRFAEHSGIRVLPVFDSEAVKTVGLANRLLAEQAYPVADVFWGNEEFRTRQMERRGVWSPSRPWASFGSRSRRIVLHTGPDAPDRIPANLRELTDPFWRGRVSIAHPLFGSTATHFLALRQHWGVEAFAEWARALMANRPFVEEGNSQVVRRVARGEAWVGLTDSDDIAAAVAEGLPVRAMPVDGDLLRMPNTVAVVRDGPNPLAARRLAEYLAGPEVLEALVRAGGLEGVAAGESPGLRPDWNALLDDLEAGTRDLEALFPR